MISYTLLVQASRCLPVQHYFHGSSSRITSFLWLWWVSWEGKADNFYAYPLPAQRWNLCLSLSTVHGIPPARAARTSQGICGLLLQTQYKLKYTFLKWIFSCRQGEIGRVEFTSWYVARIHDIWFFPSPQLANCVFECWPGGSRDEASKVSIKSLSSLKSETLWPLA